MSEEDDTQWETRLSARDHYDSAYEYTKVGRNLSVEETLLKSIAHSLLGLLRLGIERGT